MARTDFYAMLDRIGLLHVLTEEQAERLFQEIDAATDAACDHVSRFVMTRFGHDPDNPDL